MAAIKELKPPSLAQQHTRVRVCRGLCVDILRLTLTLTLVLRSHNVPITEGLSASGGKNNLHAARIFACRSCTRSQMPST